MTNETVVPARSVRGRVPPPIKEYLELDLERYWESLGIPSDGQQLPRTGSMLGNSAAAISRAIEAERRARALTNQLNDLKSACRRHLRRSKEDRDLIEAMVE